MPTDWFEICAWTIALLLVHEGLARRTRACRNGFTRVIPSAGAAILFIGSGFWYWNSQASQQLADMLQMPTLANATATQMEEIKNSPLPQRTDYSIRIAQAAFVSGHDFIDVITDEGVWIAYSPSAEDIKARDRQLKMISELDSRRQELILGAKIAEQNSIRWLISLLISVCTGINAGRLRSR